MSDQISIALISAVAALSGVVVSQVLALLTAHLNRKHAKQEVLRQKYEKLIEHINLALAQMPLNSLPKAKDGIGFLAETRAVYGLSLIYFPLILPFAKDFFSASLELYNALVSGEDDQITPASNQFFKARNDLEKAISEFAKQYT